MSKKIMKMINQVIRRGSGVNLNLFRYAAMVFVLLTLGVGNAWASSTTYYYTKGSVSVKTGSGTVYINTASPATSGSSTTSSTAATKSCDKTSTQNGEQTYYLSAVPATDWRFDSWTLSNWSTNPSSTAATTTGKIKAASSNSNSPSTATAQATFKQISIASVNKTSVTLNPTDARTSCTDYTGSVTFTTTNDNASTQIGAPSFEKTGSGTWTASNSWAAGTSTVTYTFKGNGYYGGSGTASGSRNNSATLTLPTAGGTSTKSVTFTANFPALVIADGETDVVSPKGPTDDGDGAVTFDVTYFDGLFDISSAVISNETGGTWTLGSMSYEQTNAATGAGVVTVPFTFNAGGATGDFSAKLTITPAANTGASAKEVTLTAHVDALSSNDASVTPLGGSATEYATFAEALAAANAADGCTLKLLRDVEGITTSQEIKKTMTLDLNRYSLSGTLSSAGGLLKLNTAGKILTITDTQAGGKISVSGNIDGRIAAVDIQKGSLVLAKGDLLAQNANTGTTQANIYCATVYLAASTAMSMANGSITANRTGASGKYCYGIYCGGTGSTAAAVNLTGGTIEANFANGTYAEGVYSTGTSLIQNMNITASAKSYSYAIWLQDGHLAVNGGTYSGTTSTNGARAIYTYTHPDTKNALAIQNATLNATAGTTDAKGLYCQSRTATTTAEPTDANIILSNVTINSETLGTTEAYAIYTYDAGVCLLVNSGTYNAIAKTTTATAIRSAGYTAVLSGTFNATATTTTARGLHVAGSIAAVKAGAFTAIAETDLANGADIESNGKLLVYGGTFKGHLNKIAASKYAIGTNVKAGGTLEAQGGTFIGEAANTTLGAKQTSFACGVYGVDGNSTINMSNSTMRGELLSNYLSNGDASTWNGGAYGFYSRSTNPCGLTNCTINAVSAYQGGFGLRFANTPAEVRNCTVTVTTTYAYNYGIFTGGTCDLKVYNSNFNCTSGTTYGYGIYAYNGTIYAENCTFDVTTQRTGATSAADCYLYGVNVNTSKTATLNGCTINATGSGQYSNNGYGVYVNGTAEIEDCKVTVSGINSGAYAIGNTSSTTRIGVASGKFKATATSTGVSTNGTAAAAKQQLYGGYYNTNNNLEKYLPAGYGIETLQSSSTEYGEGYRYAVRPSTNLNPVCKIGSTPYYSLEEALEFVNKNSGTAYTILMTANYTLPAGNYILPSNATLLVPYDGQTSAMGTSISSSLRSNTRTTPSVNLKLTFATGANLTAFGVIETGGREYDANGGTQTGGVNGKFGQIALNSGSHIDLEDGSKLQCWGYVTGAGTITAKSGSKAYEHFEFGVNKGGTIMSGLISNNKGVFAVDDYFYQNIEAEITYKPGSEAFASSGMYIQGNRAANGVKIVGASNEHLFKMSTDEVRPNMWVRKKYDPTTDRCTWTLNDGAQFSSINITISGYGMNSSNFVLPIASSMDIVMNYGTLAISSTQKVMLIPGSRMIIKKDATLQVPSGTKFYVWDVAQWNLGSPVAQYVYSAAYQPTRPSTNPRGGLLKNKTNLPSGEIYVQGTLEVSGDIQTTAGGAYIHSTNEDAGQIVFKTNATATGTVYQYTDGKNYTASSTTSAKLQNGDGTYEATAGTSNGDKWIYRDDKWVKVSTSGCFVVETISGTPHYYAHPKDWVEVTANTPDDHAYHVTADPTRFVIQGADCNWIEVAKEGSDYKCINENSIYYGSYFEWSEGNGYWVEKKVSISFNNQGSVTTYNNIPYKTVPQYAGATPKINATSTEYYTWIGWAKGSTEGEFFAKDADLPEATENTTYYAIFETHKYSYAVVFKNYDGSILQTSSWEAGQVPYYLAETDPVKPATAAKVYTFTGWSPATFSAVTGTGQVYTAQFAELDRTYTVQWVNYNGTVLKEEQVKYGVSPSAPATPTRPNDTYYTYTFDAWTPAISAVSGNQTYTATYNYEKKVTKYAITFKNRSETVYTQNLQDGETPVFGGTTPTKAADAQYTYTFDGWSATEGGAVLASLPAVSGAAKTYYAHFATTTNAYTIRWKSIDGKQLYETDENVEYGATPTYNGDKPTKARQGATVYTFDGWSSTIGGAKIALPTVSADATYYAHFSDDPVYTVTFNANGHGTAPAEQEVVKNQLVIKPSDPAAAGWIFGGWYKEAGCTNAWNFASDAVTANTTLYAKWTEAEATVTVNDVTTNYATLQSAITAANGTTNATVKVLKGVTITSQIAIGAAMTIDLNGKTITSTLASNTAVFKIAASGKTITISDSGTDGKIEHTANFAGKLYGINLNAGSLNIDGGTIFAKNTANSNDYRAYAIYTDGSAGSITMSKGTLHAESPQMAFGIYDSKGCPITMTGGIVEASGTTSIRGIYIKGTTTLTDATITATATGSNSIAIFGNQNINLTIHSGTYTATGTSECYAISERSGINITINGGRFSGATKELKEESGTTTIYGGVYAHNTGIEAKCATNYHVLSNADATYKYKVAEAYIVTFMNGSTQLQSGYVGAGVQPLYAGTPSKDADAQYTYSFDGWSMTDGGDKLASLPVVSANATYYAHYEKTEQKYTVAVAAGAHGAVSPASVSSIGCETASGDIKATPDAGYSFSSWTLPEGVTPADGFTAGSNPIHIHATAAEKTITANFAARTDINYTVRHFQQNIADNNYTEVTADAQTLHGTTATATNAVAKNYTGFTAQAFEQGIVAGDGSTVVEIYYNRKTYTITWVDGNGMTIETDEHVKYGATPSYDGETPTKTATAQYTYSFSGWDPTVSAVTAAATYTAQFVEIPQVYAVTLHTNEGTINSGNVDSYTYGTGATLPTNVTRTGKDFAGWYDNSELTGSAVTAISISATGAKEYWARWVESMYTITWLNWNGDPLGNLTITSTIHHGGQPAYNTFDPTPTRESSNGRTYAWDGWTTEVNGAGTYYAKDNLPLASGDATYYAHFRITDIVALADDAIEIEGSTDVETTTVHVTGKLTVNSGTLTTTNLILEGTPTSSGEIVGNVVASQKAYFDFSNGTEGFKARTWYAVAVPWQVEVPAYDKDHNGVYLTNDGVSYTQQELGRSFDLIYYNGARRASEGHSDACWQYIEDDAADKHIMYPGRAYMIYLTSNAQTIRFERKAKTPLQTNTLAVATYGLGTGNNKDANWNGIANPATYHAYINANVKDYSSETMNVGQVYNAETKTYSIVDMDANSLVVGQPIFVQATATNASVTAYAAHNDAFAAPRRAKASMAPFSRYELMFAPIEEEATDRIIVRMDEDKEENAYVIGQDLVKMGVSDRVPQLWVNRYDSKMCINTMAPVNNTADYPMGISVQKDGEYELFIDDQPNDETMLYLTYDGEAIWNLSYGGYVATLTKGTNTHYGLRIVYTERKTPTGIEQTTIQNGESIRKVLVDDKVYIIRGNNVYSIDGQLVK